MGISYSKLVTTPSLTRPQQRRNQTLLQSYYSIGIQLIYAAYPIEIIIWMLESTIRYFTGALFIDL
jgi:hypothetical protein